MKNKDISNIVGKTVYRIRQRLEMKKVNSQKWSAEYAYTDLYWWTGG